MQKNGYFVVFKIIKYNYGFYTCVILNEVKDPTFKPFQIVKFFSNAQNDVKMIIVL